MLPIHTWVWGHPWEHAQPIRDHTHKETLLSLSSEPSAANSSSLVVGPQVSLPHACPIVHWLGLLQLGQLQLLSLRENEQGSKKKTCKWQKLFLAIRGTKIKTTLWFSLTLVRMTEMKINDNEASKDVGKGAFHLLLVGVWSGKAARQTREKMT